MRLFELFMLIFYHCAALYCIWRMLVQMYSATCSTTMGGAIIGMIFVLPWALFAAVILVRVYLPRYCEWFGMFLYLPRKRLSKPVVIHSRAEGLLAREEYDLAEEELKKILFADALDTGANELMVSVLERRGDVARAADFLAEYLAHPGREADEPNAKLVLRYADLRPEGAGEVLTRELKRPYTRPAKRLLQTRLLQSSSF